MRKDIPMILCEVEYARGKEVPGNTYTVAIDGVTAELDLCPADDTRLLGPLRSLMAQVDASRVIDGTPLRYQCEYPGCSERFGHGTSRAKHYREAHVGWTPPGKTPHRAKRGRGVASTARVTRKKASGTADPVAPEEAANQPA